MKFFRHLEKLANSLELPVSNLLKIANRVNVKSVNLDKFIVQEADHVWSAYKVNTIETQSFWSISDNQVKHINQNDLYNYLNHGTGAKRYPNEREIYSLELIQK